MIQASDLRKSFGTLVAVDGVSFEVGKGETFGLLGPNGAGKSTTINMIIGALRPDSGEVLIDGSKAASSVESRMKIGVAPQALALYEELTAQENLSFFGAMYGLAGEQLAARIESCLAFAELKDRKDDAVRTFSGGMKRRLNIAIALIHEPLVVLFDEPTAGVDPQSRNHIFEGIEKLKSDGKTVLYTTHYMEEAERLCDRVAIMDNGKILAIDTVENLIQAHGGKSKIVAELSHPPESLDGFEAEIEGNVLTVTSDKPLEDLARLARSGMNIRSLNLVRSDLETVFLNLTGRSLRD